VKSEPDPTGAIPSWIGEEIPVPYEVAQEVAEVRGFVEGNLNSGVSIEETSILLTHRYPADKETVQRALAETVEQVDLGIPMPTTSRMVFEDWGEFVIIHSNFGSLTNRALAQLLGQLLSDKLGFAIVVQHDPYRIFVQTMERADATRIMEVFDGLKTMPEEAIRETLTKSTIKTGLFKRRVIHVARRFGALKKWADFSNVSLQKLIQSFEGTPIYEEGLKEIFTKDLSIDGLIQVLKQLREEKIQLVAVNNWGSATPVARIGIERVSMKTDLIPPERLHAVLAESAKARLLNETGHFICINCWSYSEMIRIADLPDKPKCPRCGSLSLGLLKVEEEKVDLLIEKKGQKLTKEEERLRGIAQETAKLIEKYGKIAAVALSARKVRISDVAEVLEKESTLSDKFYELVLDAERKTLSRRFG